ncbi:hypothetical protein CHH80_10780 [Bacillus sp. 7504-2]|nr:hypothetical protein CHH80_10780 [Bacillus sp. 7504-2]
MAQIKVGTGLINPKSINVFRNGAWEMKRMGRVFHLGLWKDFIQYGIYLYNEGVDLVSFAIEQPDRDYWNFSVQNFPTHKLLTASSWAFNVSGEGSIRTAQTVDITTYKKMKVQIGVMSGADTNQPSGFISISRNPNDRYTGTGTVAINRFKATASGSVVELDISSLTGVYYVRVGLTSSVNSPFSMEVKSIWLE